MMKKILIAILCCALLLGLIGCSQQATENEEPEEVDTEEPVPSEVMVIKYGHNYPTDSPAHMAAEVFKEEVETRSNGQMLVEIYPAMQLGSNREQLEGVQQGSIHIDLQPTAIAGNFVPEMAILDLPFVFPNEDVLWKVLDGSFGQGVMAKFEDKGIKGLGFTWTGFKQITADRPIQNISDLGGLKIRVMNSPLLLEQYSSWGSNPIPIDFGELYNALQQGVVNGEENNFWTIATQKYYEVQSDLAVTNHAPLPAVLMANKAWFDGLTEEQQGIIAEAGRKAVLKDREELGAVEDVSIETIRDYGVVFHELSDAEIQEFKDASESIYDFIREELGDEILDDLLTAVEENS